MTTAVIIVLLIRLLVPLTIFKYRISGAVASIVVDALDVVVVEALQSIFGEPRVGFGDYYQAFDKWLDMYYLAIEAIICLTWSNHLARNTAIILFLFRLTGIGLFEITGEQFRKLIFFFPNLFENFFLYYIICERFFPRLIPTRIRTLTLVLVILYIPKCGQEYLLHFTEAKPWQWIKGNLL